MKTARNFLKALVDGAIYVEAALWSSAHRKDQGGKRKVLILRKDGLGDCVIFYPFLSEYRKFYADAEITVVMPAIFASLAPLLAGFEHVIFFDKAKFAADFFYRRRFLLGLRKAGYDVAIYPVFSREPIGDFMMKMAAAREAIGCDGDTIVSTPAQKAEGDKAYTKLIRFPESLSTEIERGRYMAEQVTGREISVAFPTIDVSILPGQVAAALMGRHGLNAKKYVVIFPGAGYRYRTWPTDRFAAVADHLFEKGITPVVCGSSSERSLVREIAGAMRHPEGAIDLSGQTDFSALAHILATSLFYFGSETGPLHLAAAIGTPAICILGGGHFGRFFPYGDPRKNRVIFDEHMTCKNDNWACAKDLPEGVPAPCIAGISLGKAERAVDDMLMYTNAIA